MAVQIENLGSLDRKMTLEFARADLAKAHETRLAKVGKTMKMAGFRPGKAPKSLVEKQHGMQIDFELQYDKAAELFYEQAQKEGLALAGQPRFEPKSQLKADTVLFDVW
ncbi:MAG TPA: trigger factor, partial [Polynucleobacter sp.]|nr:trigger factor [Polynucleobacter sp.]